MNTCAKLQYKTMEEMEKEMQQMSPLVTNHYKEKLLTHFRAFANQPETQVGFEKEFGHFEDEYYAGLPPIMRRMPGNPTILAVWGLVDCKPE
jgi:hypothetical protein